MAYAVEVRDLVKRYGEAVVLNGISFSVPQGEIFGLLGTNGAGKTTTLECIEGLRSCEGQIAVRGDVGVQLQSTSLPANIKAGEALTLFSKWRGSPVPEALAGRLGIRDFAKKEYRKLSTGQKRRLHLALSVIGDPDIVILDEPTAGLDVEGRAALHEEVRALKRGGKTVILASHDMAEVEALCDRIAIVHEGRIAFDGTPKELVDQRSETRILRLRTTKGLAIRPSACLVYVKEDQGYSVFEASDLSGGLLTLLQAAQEQQATVLDVQIEQPKLEERFLELAKGAAE